MLLISEGLDADAGEGLDFEAERLAKWCARLIWRNPLLRQEGFDARPAGIRAILPYVDEFLPVHNVASLNDISAALDRPRASRSGVRADGPRGGGQPTHESVVDSGEVLQDDFDDRAQGPRRGRARVGWAGGRDPRSHLHGRLLATAVDRGLVLGLTKAMVADAVYRERCAAMLAGAGSGADARAAKKVGARRRPEGKHGRNGTTDYGHTTHVDGPVVVQTAPPVTVFE